MTLESTTLTAPRFDATHEIRCDVTSAPDRTRPDAVPQVALVPDFECLEDAIAAGLDLPCQAADPDLFFADAPAEVERAKAMCQDCPVRELCLAAALGRREPWGVWGGEWFAGGNAVGHKRPRGRPRKDAA